MNKNHHGVMLLRNGNKLNPRPLVAIYTPGHA